MATLSNFGIPGSPGILHPRLSNKFRVTFLNIGTLVSGFNSRDLQRQVTTTTLPNMSWEEVAIHRYNSTAYVNGKHSWEPISLTFEDDMEGLGSRVIEAQMETQQRLIGSDLDGRWLNSAATGSDYKFAMLIEQMDGDEAVLMTWVMEGCGLQSVDFGSRDYAASEAATITCSIRYDHAYKINSAAGYGTALGGAFAGQ